MKYSFLKIFVIVFIALFGFKINEVYAADGPNADYMVSNYVSCGAKNPTDSGKGALMRNIPSIIPSITSTIYNALMVIIPTIMIVLGIADMVRALASQSEDEIKKGRTNFIKRLIVGILTFLIVLITKFLVGAVSNSNNSVRITKCIDCFVSNSCDQMTESVDSNSNSNAAS